MKSKSPASDFMIDEVCNPGHTLLWDLVQDNMTSLLPEGMAAEAEKALTNLLCCSNDRQIRTKFIEAIIDNLAKNKSVVVSLRLLTKLFSSFNSMRPMQGSYKIVLWAEKSLDMMSHFFNNLVNFSEKSRDRSSWTSHHGFKEEVSSRLMFLSCVFSSQYSPDSFSKLNFLLHLYDQLTIMYLSYLLFNWHLCNWFKQMAISLGYGQVRWC